MLWCTVTKPRHAYHSHWCTLLEFHLKRKRMTVSEFARLAKRSQQSVHAYYVGKTRPPVDLMPLFCDVLGLRGSERDQFIIAAWESWTPEVVWKRLMTLESKSHEPRPRDQLEEDLALARAVIQKLIGIMQRIEELFYTRTVPMHKIRESRENLGLEIRRAIEQHAKPG